MKLLNLPDFIDYNEDDEIDDELDDEKKGLRSLFKEELTARKLREANKRRNQLKYLNASMYELWSYGFYIDFKEEIPDMFISSDCINKYFYTLYDIIIYTYILSYGEKYGFISFESNKIKDARMFESLGEIAMTISTNEGLEEYGDDTDVREDTHYKVFYEGCLRKIKRFLNFIFASENALSLFQNGRSKVFNVLDYGFFAYLFNPKHDDEINWLIKGKYERITSDFFAHIYLGLKHLVQFHDIELQVQDIDKMFTEKFKIDRVSFFKEWYNQKLFDDKNAT